MFMDFDAAKNTLNIEDLSSPMVFEGSYSSLKLILKDMHSSQTFEFTLHVLPPTSSTEDLTEDSTGALEKILNGGSEARKGEPKESKDLETTVGSHPVPYLIDVTQDGVLLISFSEEINIAANFTLIENGTLLIDG